MTSVGCGAAEAWTAGIAARSGRAVPAVAAEVDAAGSLVLSDVVPAGMAPDAAP
jgi:hypothetical protein